MKKSKIQRENYNCLSRYDKRKSTDIFHNNGVVVWTTQHIRRVIFAASCNSHLPSRHYQTHRCLHLRLLLRVSFKQRCLSCRLPLSVIHQWEILNVSHFRQRLLFKLALPLDGCLTHKCSTRLLLSADVDRFGFSIVHRLVVRTGNYSSWRQLSKREKDSRKQGDRKTGRENVPAPRYERDRNPRPPCVTTANQKKSGSIKIT